MKTLLVAFFISIFGMLGTVALAAEPNVEKVPLAHYSGTWLEIARRPMWITDGCVAGFTTYRAGKNSKEIEVLDGCHDTTPSGKLKTVKGKGRLLDADARRAKLRVQYPFFITYNYWVLYVSPDKSWFISADPQLKNLWIYARHPPTKNLLSIMVRKARALGYDVSKLEFPPAR